jgi:antitoxin component YwqK of YwqJK toxin-antitoxin module
MGIRFLFLFSFLVLNGIAQEDAPNKTDAAGKKQGHWIKYDDNHKKLYDGNFVNDVPVGKFIYYYDTGIPWAITVFMKNGTVAYTKHYGGGGKLTGYGKYVNQQKDSLWKFFNEDSTVISEENYVNGLKNGSCKVFYNNGQIAEEKIWKMGKLNGPSKKYFMNGQLKFSGTYVNDKMEGKATYYYASGKIDGEGVYKNDLKDGTWNYYLENGKVRRTDKYKDGKMVSSTDLDYETKEQIDEEKKKYEQFEIKNPYEEGYRPE